MFKPICRMGIFRIASESHFEVRSFCIRNRGKLGKIQASQITCLWTFFSNFFLGSQSIIVLGGFKTICLMVMFFITSESHFEFRSFCALFLVQNLRNSKWDSEAIRKMPILQIGLNTHQTLLFWPPNKKLPKKVGGHMIWEAWILPIFA